MAENVPVPVIIGVADITNRSKRIEDALEPLELMLRAFHAAIEDTGIAATSASKLRSQVDSIDVVATWTWPYADLPGLIAERLGVHPSHGFYSKHGGNQPAKLVDEAARRISQGKCKVALITGGEALASLNECVKAKKLPPPGWTKPVENVESVLSPTTEPLCDDVEATYKIGAPIHVYPLYENALRAHRKQTAYDNNNESAILYADFAKIAEKNPYAWNYGRTADTAQTIATVSKKNRMICFPYPLLMNAFNTVNLAAAVIVTSQSYAEELGVPKDKWIYPLGGAGTQDSDRFYERPNFYSSPAISQSLDAGLAASGLTKDQVDLFDIYSCFPIVPKLVCRYLDLPILDSPRPITLLGGLTSFGGAGNNYSMHSITEMVRQLRQRRGQNGLVLANGGVLTYQHVLCLSSRPRRYASAYPGRNPLPEVLTGLERLDFVARAEGEALVETYTVEYSRDGFPTLGHVVGKLKKGGSRFIANHGDQITLQLLCSRTEEPIGKTGYVRAASGKIEQNIFTFTKEARL